MATLVDKLVPDELWAIVEPLLPPPPGHPTAAGTTPSASATASPRSSAWPAPPPHGLVARERGLGQRAGQAWENHVGATPVDRGTPGSKIHLVCEGGGLPLTAAVTPPTPRCDHAAGGGRRPPTGAHPVGAAAPPARHAGRRQGLRQCRQPGLAAASWDPGADRPAWDRVADAAGAVLVRVGRALSWLSCDRRLAVRWDRGSERLFEFVLLAYVLVCSNRR
jgi:hypothetical protein